MARSGPLQLSVLDLIPVRTGQTTADALAATLALAKVADDLGLTRYWLAEHHNTEAVASTNPAVEIAMVASATSRIKVGSGGVMLPNHAPLVVAEQFALLEAAFPGRIDLGLGRAPGTDPATSWALRHGAAGVTDEIAWKFDQFVSDLLVMMGPDGAAMNLQGRTHPLRATPKAASVPEVWLLGSSDYSASVAAALGLPYVFAHHFGVSTGADATPLYRSQFRPSEHLAAPRTFLTLNAVVAETQAEAEALARPNLLSMLALRTGQLRGPQPSVEQAAATEIPEHHLALAEDMASRWVVGDPETAAARIRELAEAAEVDEVMVHPIAGAHEGDDPRRSPARETTLRLLAQALAN